jgi:hypothetical protein
LSTSRALVAAGLAVWLAAGDAGGAARAEQISEATAGALSIGGPDAIGGVGDWYLANEIVEVVVDDPGRRFGKRNHGGVIVDAGLRDRRGEDQFAELFPLLNLDQRVDLRFDHLAEVDPGAWARLVISGLARAEASRAATGRALFDLLVPDAAGSPTYASRPSTRFSPASRGCASRRRSATTARARRRSSPTGTS